MPSKSTRKRRPGKVSKPHPDFPLFPHATGRWAKKIKGKFCYFGKTVDDPQGQAALERWLDEKDDLLAGRTPRAKADGLTVADLCNHFLTAKKHLADTGEITLRTCGDYFTTCKQVVAALGKDRLLTDLGGGDFDHLRRVLAKTRGPVALGNEIGRVRVLFKFGYDASLIDRPVRYGATFKRPTKKVLRIARAKVGPRMFDAPELRRIIESAPMPLRTMILLGTNCGYGNHDCATLPMKALDLDKDWLVYSRPKTGIDRRCPLWPETVAALREAIANRPTPKAAGDAGLVFLTKRRQPWGKDTKASPISAEFRKLLVKLNLYRRGRGFYALRHTFATVASGSRDQVAVDYLMGHCPSSADMSARYRERIGDDRLEDVTEYVREWLYDSEKNK